MTTKTNKPATAATAKKTKKAKSALTWSIPDAAKDLKWRMEYKATKAELADEPLADDKLLAAVAWVIGNVAITLEERDAFLAALGMEQKRTPWGDMRLIYKKD